MAGRRRRGSNADAVHAARRQRPLARERSKHRRDSQVKGVVDESTGEARARRVPDATDDRAQEPPGLGAAGLAPQTEHGLASIAPGL